MAITCQRIGRPPISTSALGIDSVRSRRRVPRPPQRMATGGPATAGTLAALARRPAARFVEHLDVRLALALRLELRPQHALLRAPLLLLEGLAVALHAARAKAALERAQSRLQVDLVAWCARDRQAPAVLLLLRAQG